ncbi:uncharacterized protein LOC129022107 isoform X2 [Pongo pygmaeus]|uniref:uncharacterized protein LOC129022107 isoform X2 n=1 Tax=Pongo pygmaeus TaxID=9600 RepID=UPI0023E2FCE3|nr:uncharacterized protein LOC129022107 isoform X2 [Pongo pygmaeus]
MSALAWSLPITPVPEHSRALVWPRVSADRRLPEPLPPSGSVPVTPAPCLSVWCRLHPVPGDPGRGPSTSDDGPRPQITVCGFCDVYQGDILKLERGSAPGGETAHGSRETPPPRTPSGTETGRPSRVVGTVRGPVPRAPLSQGRQQQPDTRRALGTPPRPRPLLILPHSIPLHTGRSHQSSAAGASTPCECSVGLTLRALLSRLWNLCHPSRHRSASPAAAPPAWAHPRAPSVPSFLLAGLSPVALWPNMSSAVVLSTRCSGASVASGLSPMLNSRQLASVRPRRGTQL